MCSAMVKDKVIRTSRLLLEPVCGADLEGLHKLWTDERVRQFLWDNQVVPIEQTREVIEGSCGLFDERGFGIWGVRQHESPELVGFTGYWYFRTPAELELLFGIASKYWGRGFATEASDSVLRHGFEVLGFNEIAASTDAENVASIRVLEKLGIRFGRRAVVNGLDTLFYKLKKEDWLSAS